MAPKKSHHTNWVYLHNFQKWILGRECTWANNKEYCIWWPTERLFHLNLYVFFLSFFCGHAIHQLLYFRRQPPLSFNAFFYVDVHGPTEGSLCVFNRLFALSNKTTIEYVHIHTHTPTVCVYSTRNW